MDERRGSTWGRWLRERMTEQGRSEADLEGRLGWEAGRLRRLLEADETDLEDESLRRVIEALGFDASALAQGAPAAAALEPPIDFERIHRLVARVVREELERQRKGTPGPESRGPGPQGSDADD